MLILIFLVGALLGVLLGGTLCVRYLRQEVSAGIVPRLRRMQLQLDNLEVSINLALVTRYAEFSSGHVVHDAPRQVLIDTRAAPVEDVGRRGSVAGR